MTLTLMYITADPVVAAIAERHGVDWIFVDLESLGKQDRQGHLDTVISGHTIDDVKAVRSAINQTQLLVRCNPMHEVLAAEIDQIVEAGADIIMLPYFKSAAEVSQFMDMVADRARTCLLLETAEAFENLDAILQVDGIDRIHIGLNDLHLSMGLDFMFELLTNGMVESIAQTVRSKGIPFGFGGMARLGEGALRADDILAEHFRLGSSSVILSRGFFDPRLHEDHESAEMVFAREVPKIRDLWNDFSAGDEAFFAKNKAEVERAVDRIVQERKSR